MTLETIQASNGQFMVAIKDSFTVRFKASYRPECELSRVEYLIPLKNRSCGGNATTETGVIEINGRTFSSSDGAFKNAHSSIFDVTDLFIKNKIKSEGISNFNVKASLCHPSHLRRSMLFEYCNMNKTTLKRFWTHHHSETRQDISNSEPVTDGDNHFTIQAKAFYSEQKAHAVLDTESLDNKNKNDAQGFDEENELKSKKDRKIRNAGSMSGKLQEWFLKRKLAICSPEIGKCQRKQMIAANLRLKIPGLFRPTAVDLGYCAGSCKL